MGLGLVVQNVLNPAVLFFFLGMLAVAARSDLEIPQPIPKVLSQYLLISIGFRGGVELRSSGLDTKVFVTLVAAISMALLVPLYTFFFLRRRIDTSSAAAIAATYGSVSAVTFITACSFLSTLGIKFDGHMVAAMALMESPAIVAGVLLARRYGAGEPMTRSALLHDAFLNASVFVLLGSLVVGAATGQGGLEAVGPFLDKPFKGVLCLFLLDMGIVSARRLGGLRKIGGFLVGFALVVPLVNAVLGIVVARVLGLSQGNALLFTVLSASASYIAVPAAMRLAVPDANPGVYVSLSLAVTFPLNVIVGIPVYLTVIRFLWG